MNIKKKGIGIFIAAILVISVFAAMIGTASAQQGPEVQVTDFEAYADQPAVAVDSNGNVHIAYFYTEEYWGSTTYNSREIWYTMLDNNGNTLIDDTPISTDDGSVPPDTDDGGDSVHPDIAVDSNDMVHIVWRTSSNLYDIWYTKLDPSLDDQDGDAADAGAITEVDDIELTDIDDYCCHPRMAIDSNDDIHIVWELDGDVVFYYMKIDDNGNELVAPVTVNRGGWYGRPDVAVDSTTMST